MFSLFLLAETRARGRADLRNLYPVAYVLQQCEPADLALGFSSVEAVR
jgi:hypothetical protein